MFEIININDVRFSLNGVEYLKNYISKVSGSSIEIFNCYERRDILVPFNHYNKFTVNGNTYASAAALQSALLSVIYGRNTLGGFVLVDATPTQKGVLKLAGDLSGTADLPTVPGLVTKLNKGANTEYERLSDASNIYGFYMVSRTGAVTRLDDVVFDNDLKRLTVKGTQAIWRAYEDVTDGNMGIFALIGAIESFKIYDNIGNFFSTGTDAITGQRVLRINNNLRLMNGVAYIEKEYKQVMCMAGESTVIKTVNIPANSVVTIDVSSICVMNTAKKLIQGYAKFCIKHDGTTVTNESIDANRYGGQYSTIKAVAGAVTNTDTRFDISITGTTITLNFVNTEGGSNNANAGCEVIINKTLLPE